MIYLVFVLIALATTFVVCGFGAWKGTVDPGERVKLYKPCEEAIVPFRGSILILIITICLAVSVAMQMSLYKNTSIVNFIKLYGVFVVVACAAIVDVKRSIIPNVLILFGLLFRAGIYVYEFFAGEDLKAILTNDGLGVLIGFGLLAVVSLVSKGALGFGDAKLFGIIGLTCGSFCTYSTLFLSLVISTVFSFIAIAGKKMGKKDRFPFGPCILAGYILVIFLGSY